MSLAEKTTEPQYSPMLKRRKENGVEKLGLSTNYAWNDDPKRLAFTLARYKFVAKMLAGKQNALEVGCGDAFGTRIVQQEVAAIVAIDFDERFVADVNDRKTLEWPFECYRHDILDGPVMMKGEFRPLKFSAAYCLDVIEHIDQPDEHLFIKNIAQSIDPNGVAIFGTPTLASQPLASKLSKQGHVNCKDGPDLKVTLGVHFHNVFMFSMNDEIVHTGHHAMAHYIFAVCAGVRT